MPKQSSGGLGVLGKHYKLVGLDLPLWAWIGIAVAGYVVYTRIQNETSQSAQTAPSAQQSGGAQGGSGKHRKRGHHRGGSGGGGGGGGNGIPQGVYGP